MFRAAAFCCALLFTAFTFQTIQTYQHLATEHSHTHTHTHTHGNTGHGHSHALSSAEIYHYELQYADGEVLLVEVAAPRNAKTAADQNIPAPDNHHGQPGHSDDDHKIQLIDYSASVAFALPAMLSAPRVFESASSTSPAQLSLSPSKARGPPA